MYDYMARIVTSDRGVKYLVGDTYEQLCNQIQQHACFPGTICIDVLYVEIYYNNKLIDILTMGEWLLNERD